MVFRLNGDAVKSGGAEDRLLPWDRVQDMVGISRTTAWRMQRCGAFPSPVPVSPGRVGWWESELTAWKATRGDAIPLSPPARPRLPGMPRRAPVHALAPTGAAMAQRDLPMPPPAGSAAAPRPRRRRSAAGPDQIDFGF